VTAGTWAVITMDGDREHVSGGFDEAGAAEMARDITEQLGVHAWTRDLLPGLEAQFPEGTRVWLGERVHWRPGQAGYVVPGEPESYAKWPEAGPTPWFLSNDGASVCVRLDDGMTSWWPARWLETRG
jgi:hypothetical protein